MNTKIAIAGAGYVGLAYANMFHDIANIDVFINDPHKGIRELNYTKADCVIICVSTPEAKDGSCDISNVIDVIAQCPNIPILIKSTISLEGWKQINQHFPNSSITFSPEFLRAESASEDLRNADTIMLGGTGVDYWSEIFKPLKHVVVATPEELILIKYFRNSFLATKVSFFNQIYDLCEAIGVDYDAVSNGVAMDKRIGDSHTRVTKERGFGGHCFPKDTSAIVSTARQYNVELSLIEEAISYNNSLKRK